MCENFVSNNFRENGILVDVGLSMFNIYDALNIFDCPPSLIHRYTWDFSIASQNFDSALNLFTFVRQDSEVADITLLLIVGGRAVLF